jgi:bifunctional non-homologous end joining protein LigD
MRGEGNRENWLLVKERDKDSHQNGVNPDFLESLSYSVSSGRSMGEIATGVQPPLRKNTSAPLSNSLKHLMERYPEVQLATLVDTPPEGDQWLHEIKFDGHRLLGFVADGISRLRTRNGKDWTDAFPHIAEALEKLKANDAVLDLEAVILNKEGKSSFQALQAALREGGNRAQIIGYAFDLLYLDGKDLTMLPFK